MLSNTSKYAIRALIYLELFSRKDHKIGIRKISSELDIPSPFLGKIMQTMVHHGFLSSVKGPGGGFYLHRSAADITLMDIIELMDGKDVFDMCVIRTNKCDHQKPCSMHHKLAPLRAEMKKIFYTETIADLVSEFREGRERIKI